MSQHLIEIQKDYLQKAWVRGSKELEEALPARYEGNGFHFRAFGEPCELYQQEILLGGQPLIGPEGILIALYARHVQKEEPQLRPLKSFKQFPGSMGYQGGFSMNAEKILLPFVPAIQKHQQELIDRFHGHFNPEATSCDFSFTLYPLPRVALYYIFSLSDEEFPATAV